MNARNRGALAAVALAAAAAAACGDLQSNKLDKQLVDLAIELSVFVCGVMTRYAVS